MIITEKLLAEIDTNSLHMANQWAQEITDSAHTRMYKKLSSEELVKRGTEDFKNIVSWLQKGFNMVEIGRVYAEIGKKRYLEKIPLCEILFVFHLSKKILWDFIVSSDIISNTVEIYQAMNLSSRVYTFYDFASFYLIRGYTEEMYKNLGTIKEIDSKLIEGIFPEGSFYYEPEDAKGWIESWNLFKVK